MEITPASGGNISREQSATMESSSSQSVQEIGGKKVIQKMSSMESEESSRVVQQSSSSTSSSRMVSSSVSSVSSSVTSQKSVTSSSMLSGIETGVLDGNGNQVADTQISLLQEPVVKQGSVTVEEKQEFYVKEQDGNVVEQQSSRSQQESHSGDVTLLQTGALSGEQEVASIADNQTTEENRTQATTGETEIRQESIKNTLKEIISEIEEAAEPEMKFDIRSAESQPESITDKRSKMVDKQTSTSSFDELTTNDAFKQSQQQHAICFYPWGPDKRPMSLPGYCNIHHLQQSLKVEHINLQHQQQQQLPSHSLTV